MIQQKGQMERQEKDVKIEKTWRLGDEREGLPKMITATSTEQRTPNSYAFLKRPFLRWMGGGKVREEAKFGWRGGGC